MNNRQIVIASLPTGKLQAENFALRTTPAPMPAEGEVLCRTLVLTVAAGQRAGLQGSASYAGAPRTGVVMGGSAVARVVASNAPDVDVGAVVACPSGWQDYSAHPAAAVRVVEDEGDPAHHLGVYGTNGLTAYFGLFDIGEPKNGQTVVVSAAAGSVGHLVGQLAKIAGCRVIGVAGGDEKCRLLTEQLGFDAAVNYRAPDFRDAFRNACAGGVDIYFDNTGGEILGGALRRMKPGGRIVCCGGGFAIRHQQSGAGAARRAGALDQQPSADGGLSGVRLRGPLRRGTVETARVGEGRAVAAAPGRVPRLGGDAAGLHRHAWRRQRRHPHRARGGLRRLAATVRARGTAARTRPCRC